METVLHGLGVVLVCGGFFGLGAFTCRCVDERRETRAKRAAERAEREANLQRYGCENPSEGMRRFGIYNMR